MGIRGGKGRGMFFMVYTFSLLLLCSDTALVYCLAWIIGEFCAHYKVNFLTDRKINKYAFSAIALCHLSYKAMVWFHI